MNLEIIQLQLNRKTGGLDISYSENVSFKVEKHKVSFPHRPKKALVNAIRKLAIHIPFLCEFEIEKDFDECKLNEDEKGFYEETFYNCQSSGFIIRRKEDIEVKVYGRKRLEFASIDKFMDITTPYFIVSDASEYIYNDELMKDISEI
jgi:hypothetical protein